MAKKVSFEDGWMGAGTVRYGTLQTSGRKELFLCSLLKIEREENASNFNLCPTRGTLTQKGESSKIVFWTPLLKISYGMFGRK